MLSDLREPGYDCGLRENGARLELLVWYAVKVWYTDPDWLRARIAAYRKATAVSDVELRSAVAHARAVDAKADARVKKWIRVIDRSDDPTADALAALDAATADRKAAREFLAEAEAKVRDRRSLPTTSSTHSRKGSRRGSRGRRTRRTSARSCRTSDSGFGSRSTRRQCLSSNPR